MAEIIDIDTTTADFAAGTLTNVVAGSDKLTLGNPPDILTGGTASASSYYSASYVPANAADDNLNNSWTSNGLGVQWWKYDLGAGNAKTVKKLRFVVIDTNEPKNFTLQGSNDNASWTTLLTAQGVDVPNSATWQEWLVTNSTAYRYYEINITTAWSVSNVALVEVEMLEQPFYQTSGNRIHPDFALSGTASATSISWNAILNGQTIAVDAAVASDGINFGAYQACTSGQAIPGVPLNVDLANYKVRIKETLTGDGIATPELLDITAVIQFGSPQSDTTSVSIAETASLSVAIATSDTVSVSVAESATSEVPISAADQPAIVLAEAAFAAPSTPTSILRPASSNRPVPASGDYPRRAY